MKTTCPYNSTKPIYDASLFIGRAHHAKFLLDGLSKNILNSFVIIGGRRTGKSSSLIHIQNLLKEMTKPDFVPVYCDLLLLNAENAKSAETDFYKRLISSINKELSISESSEKYDYDFAQFSKCLAENFAGEKSLVLLFDETEALLKFEWATIFFANLRNSINSLGYRVSIVIAVFDWEQVQHILLRSWSLDYKKLRLEPFDFNETHDLVSLAWSNSEFSSTTIKKLLKQTGGHIYLLQKLLAQLWDIQQDKITSNDIDKVISWFFREEDESFEMWYSTNFKKLEDHIVLSILAKSDSPVPEKDFQELVLDKKELKLSLQKSLDSCLITVDGERKYYLRCLMFRNWLVEQNYILI